MRLLLDEHLSPEIARQLRALGHDAIAVAEQPELQGRADRAHFASLTHERRVLVTRDLGDFRPLLAEAARSGTTTYGLVLVSRTFALNRGDIGRLVRALHAMLREHPADDAVTGLGGELWLEDPS